MKKLMITFLLLLIFGSAQAAKISVTVGTGALQPGTTAGMNISSGTVQELYNVQQTSSGTYTINGGTWTFVVKNTTAPVFTGIRTDKSTVTFQGATSSGTLTNITTTTFQGASFNGTVTDASTFTVTGKHNFRNQLFVSTGPTQSATFSVGLSSVVVGGSGSPGFIFGTQTNDSAPTGYVGESTTSIKSGIPYTSANRVDVSSVTITPGDWDVTGQIVGTGGSTNTNGPNVVILSLFSGATSTDEAVGDNAVFWAGAPAASISAGGSVNWEVKTVSTVQVYLKINSTFSGGSPTAFGKIIARRIR